MPAQPAPENPVPTNRAARRAAAQGHKQRRTPPLVPVAGQTRSQQGRRVNPIRRTG